MDLKNLQIGTQLKLGFATLLLFVMALGLISYWQTVQLFQQTETMYEHPLQVRSAIGKIRENIRAIQVEYRDMLLTDGAEKIQNALQNSDVYEAETLRQFGVLQERFLGPKTDVENALNAFVRWSSLHKNSRDLRWAGNINTALARVAEGGDIGAARKELFSSIGKVDDYALKKADVIFSSSEALKDRLHGQLLLIISVIVLLSILISYILSQNIRKPLAQLASATRRFHEGDMAARSSYSSANEFGVLSASFNSLAESIELNMDLNEKAAKLAGLMLSEDDARKFFQATLASLAAHTGSQMAAVYLLSDDKKTYDHFESIGLDENAKQSFSAASPEGEFGSALSAGKVQHIQNISAESRFVFHTVTGPLIPREIVTIPIHANNAVIAFVSLASVNIYGEAARQLIDTVFDTLSARIEGILAYRKIKDFSHKLEQQNIELQAQESEMSAQSAELIQQNTELEMQKNQLDEASRLKTIFLSNMSHELRTPLNSVIILSGVLHRRLADQIPAEEYSYLEVIERNGKYLLSLINNILDISRIESGREEIELTPFAIDHLIAEEVSLIQPQAVQKNIELRHIRNDSEVLVVSDADKYRHILQNIIGNAVKFTEKGHVEVTAQQKGAHIVITVSDTGIGISEDNLPHIFDEFRQADGSTSRRFGGTGLGLAIARKYAKLLGGRISVESAFGKGSQFTLTLPLRSGPENNRLVEAETGLDVSRPGKQPVDKQAPGISASEASGKTILLVDDSEPVIIQMKDILGESGYNLQVARDGREALSSISHTTPDAMILDLMMPDVDGFTVLKNLREEDRTSNIPILILTAKHITKDELRFLKRNNIHQLIQKGDVNRNELLKAVATMVCAEPLERVKPQRPLQTIAGKPVVLVVEDNPDNMLTAKALLAAGHIVLEAVDGQQGVEMARKHKPHLILMDIELPGMNGLEALKAIREDIHLQHVPVIALTASAMASDLETILAHGFSDHLVKPIDESVFFSMIDEALYGK